jgi:hypothetical protein
MQAWVHALMQNTEYFYKPRAEHVVIQDVNGLPHSRNWFEASSVSQMKAP